MIEKNKKFHWPTLRIDFTDVWVFIVIFLFTFFVDIVYVGVHQYMGLQLSDYWLLVNVIFYSIELIMITAVSISKKLRPDQKETYKEVAEVVGKSVGVGITTAITDNLPLPEITSGAHSVNSKYTDDDNSDSNIEEYENINNNLVDNENIEKEEEEEGEAVG